VSFPAKNNVFYWTKHPMLEHHRQNNKKDDELEMGQFGLTEPVKAQLDSVGLAGGPKGILDI
jgi:hypothetical protein